MACYRAIPRWVVVRSAQNFEALFQTSALWLHPQGAQLLQATKAMVSIFLCILSSADDVIAHVEYREANAPICCPLIWCSRRRSANHRRRIVRNSAYNAWG